MTFIITILSFLIVSCYQGTIPDTDLSIEKIKITNYYTNTYIYNNNEYTLPTLDAVCIDSEYGYFGYSKSGNTFTIPVYNECFYNFEKDFLNLICSLNTTRAIITIVSSTVDEKCIRATLLGANLLTNNYTIKLKRQYNTTREYQKWRELASDPKHCGGDALNIGYQYWGGVLTGRFESKGLKLILARGGNMSSYKDNYFTYQLCRVMGENVAIMKNQQTGSFICVKIVIENGVKKIYMIGPRSSKFVVQAEAPYNASMMNSVISLVTFSKSLLWAVNGFSIGTGAALTADIISLIFSCGFTKNTDLSMSEITSTGYLWKNFDTDNTYYWGTTSFWDGIGY